MQIVHYARATEMKVRYGCGVYRNSFDKCSGNCFFSAYISTGISVWQFIFWNQKINQTRRTNVSSVFIVCSFSVFKIGFYFHLFCVLVDFLEKFWIFCWYLFNQHTYIFLNIMPSKVSLMIVINFFKRNRPNVCAVGQFRVSLDIGMDDGRSFNNRQRRI